MIIIAAIIIGIILLFFVSLTFHVGNNRYDVEFKDGLTLGLIIPILVLIESVLIIHIIGDPYPTAMDVYQDKTTLEYKVVDGVNVDSVVIFKNEDYGK